MKIAVIGTGMMGSSIAQVFAQCDSVESVFLCKSRESSLRDGRDAIIRNYRKLTANGKLAKADAERYFARIRTGSLETAAEADIVIETITEDLTIKREVFSRIDGLCPPECVFATNTSSLPIREIGSGLSHVLIGMHFFNPAPVMKLVEIITTDQTPRNMVECVFNLVEKAGKTPVEVVEAPGFIVNRILIPMINEAISIYAEGVASVENIDTAMALGANHPMGPLALADLIGLDVVLAILNVMLKQTGEPKYTPQPMLKRMVREKKLGRKTGEGFYRY